MLNLLHGLVVNARNSFVLSFLSAVKFWLKIFLVHLCLAFYPLFSGKSRLHGKPDTITQKLFLQAQIGHFVVKELVHDFGCATIVMDGLKKLEFSLGWASSSSYVPFSRALQTSHKDP